MTTNCYSLTLCGVAWCLAVFFEQDQYPFHMNCRYTHSLDSRGTDSTLDSLLERKLVQFESGAFTLSPSGGRLWEIERRPDWNLFIYTLSSSNSKRFRIVAMKESVGLDYISAICDSHQIIPTSPIRSRSLGRHSLPWRTISPAIMMVVNIQGDADQHIYADWEIYESQRTWWRGVGELDSLNRHTLE